MASPTVESEEMLDSEKNPGQPASEREAAALLVKPAVEHSETSAGEAAPQKPSSAVGFVKQHPLAAAAVLLIVIAGAVALWFYFSSYETTDDAEVDGHLNPVSARISGTIIRVNPDVLNNHFVTAGTVLAEIDPADFQADVARAQAEHQRLKANAAAAHQDVAVTSSGSSGRLQAAEAAVAEASDSVASEKATVDADQARVAQAQANYTRSEADRQRWENLLAKREVSQTEYARIATQAATDNQALIAARAEYIAAQKRVSQAESRWSERRADLLGARSAPEQVASTQSKASAAVADADRAGAQLTTAELSLSYTKIIAPVSGIVGRKSIEVGQRIQPGQQLLIIIPVDDIWITANFKETQVRKMHPGQ